MFEVRGLLKADCRRGCRALVHYGNEVAEKYEWRKVAAVDTFWRRLLGGSDKTWDAESEILRGILGVFGGGILKGEGALKVAQQVLNSTKRGRVNIYQRRLFVGRTLSGWASKAAYKARKRGRGPHVLRHTSYCLSFGAEHTREYLVDLRPWKKCYKNLKITRQICVLSKFPIFYTENTFC